MAVPNLSPGSSAPAKKRHRWRWCALIAVALLLGLYLMRTRLMVLAGDFLITEDAILSADAVLILPGDTRPLDTGGEVFEEVAQLWHSGQARSVLVLESRPTRLTQIGALPSLSSMTRDELVCRGVPTASISVIGEGARTDWDRARSLRSWLCTQPSTRLIVLCKRFASKRRRLIFSRVLGEDLSASLSWRALTDRRFNETNWWRDRLGIAEVFGAYVRLAHVWWCDEPSEMQEQWDLEEYMKHVAVW